MQQNLHDADAQTYWCADELFAVRQAFHAGAAGTACLRARQPAVKRVAPVAATASSSAAVAQDPDEKPGFLGIANITWKKIVPLGFMFFAILFNYTILRDTKVRGFSYCPARTLRIVECLPQQWHRDRLQHLSLCHRMCSW